MLMMFIVHRGDKGLRTGVSASEHQYPGIFRGDVLRQKGLQILIGLEPVKGLLLGVSLLPVSVGCRFSG